jgi:hypothetical protein
MPKLKFTLKLCVRFGTKSMEKYIKIKIGESNQQNKKKTDRTIFHPERVIYGEKSSKLNFHFLLLILSILVSASLSHWQRKKLNNLWKHLIFNQFVLFLFTIYCRTVTFPENGKTIVITKLNTFASCRVTSSHISLWKNERFFE